MIFIFLIVLFFLIVVFTAGYLFSAIFFSIKSLLSKTNLFCIPAGLSFILPSAFVLICYYILSPDFMALNIEKAVLEYIIQNLANTIFLPALGIMLFMKVRRNILIIPISLAVLSYVISFIDDINKYNGIEIITHMLWMLAFASLIVLILAYKPLKYVFFMPAVFMLAHTFIAANDQLDINISEEIVYYDVLMISGLLLLGAYIVCEYPKSRAPHPAPQPAYIVVPQQTDMVHELTKYKNMLDQGLITEEDYERMKKQLLGI